MLTCTTHYCSYKRWNQARSTRLSNCTTRFSFQRLNQALSTWVSTCTTHYIVSSAGTRRFHPTEERESVAEEGEDEKEHPEAVEDDEQQAQLVERDAGDPVCSAAS